MLSSEVLWKSSIHINFYLFLLQALLVSTLILYDIDKALINMPFTISAFFPFPCNTVFPNFPSVKENMSFSRAIETAIPTILLSY